MPIKRGGGGETLERVGFGAKNGDCGARAAVTYAKYAPLHALAKPHFYHPNPTASDFALESTFSHNAPFLSLRADLSARQSINPDLESSNLDSSFSSSRGVAQAKQGKLCHLPFDDESFEVVTMLAVLEHLHHPHAMLQEIARVLKPSGALVLTVPSHAAKPVLEFLAFRLKIVSEEEIRDHKRYYNKRDLRELVALIPELTLTKHTYFQLGMNNFAIIHKRG